jgi:hypothetical protein
MKVTPSLSRCLAKVAERRTVSISPYFSVCKAWKAELTIYAHAELLASSDLPVYSGLRKDVVVLYPI